MKTMASAVLGLIVAVTLSVSAQAGTFTVSNPLYEMRVTYGFKGDRVWHDVELENKLEIEVSYGHVPVMLDCASGAKHAGDFSVPDHDVAAGDTHRFRVERDGCSPTTRYDRATKRTVEVHDEIRGVSYSGNVTMAQHGTSFVGLTWDCGDEEIIVTAIKFPQGTGFRLVASNERSMTSTKEFDAQEAAQHLCGKPVDDPVTVTAGIRKLIGEVRALCERAPKFCDAMYDQNNKRASGVRG